MIYITNSNHTRAIKKDVIWVSYSMVMRMLQLYGEAVYNSYPQLDEEDWLALSKLLQLVEPKQYSIHSYRIELDNSKRIKNTKSIPRYHCDRECQLLNSEFIDYPIPLQLTHNLQGQQKYQELLKMFLKASKQTSEEEILEVKKKVLNFFKKQYGITLKISEVFAERVYKGSVYGDGYKKFDCNAFDKVLQDAVKMSHNYDKVSYEDLVNKGSLVFDWTMQWYKSLFSVNPTNLDWDILRTLGFEPCEICATSMVLEELARHIKKEQKVEEDDDLSLFYPF